VAVKLNAAPVLDMFRICGSGFAPPNGFVKNKGSLGLKVCAAREPDSPATSANVRKTPEAKFVCEPVLEFVLAPGPVAVTVSSPRDPLAGSMNRNITRSIESIPISLRLDTRFLPELETV
jgi:hypothetical protein